MHTGTENAQRAIDVSTSVAQESLENGKKNSTHVWIEELQLSNDEYH